MGVRITDLCERVRPIAKEFRDCGFSMVDLISIGLLSLEHKTPNDIAELIKGLAKNTGDAAEEAANAARYTIRTYQAMKADEIAVSLKFLPAEESLAVQEMLETLSPEGKKGRKAGPKRAGADAKRPKRTKNRPDSAVG